MTKIKVLAVIPNKEDPTSYYRAMGPLTKMELDGEIEVIPVSNMIGWSDILKCHIVFIQRPAEQQYVNLINMAHDLNRPVWIDYDDMLWDVPNTNQLAHTYYSRRKNINEIVRNSDLVTVSTALMKDSIEKMLPKIGINPTVKVVQNAVNFDLFNYKDILDGNFQMFGGHASLLWRGSITHIDDLDLYRTAIEDISRDMMTGNIYFQGLDYNMVFTDGLFNGHNLPPSDMVKFFATLNRNPANFIIVPLRKNNFNLAKSNIAWLEASMSGKVCIAPNWPEWNVDGCINYEYQTFESVVKEYMAKPVSELRGIVSKSIENIHANFNIEKANAIRLQLIEEALELQ